MAEVVFHPSRVFEWASSRDPKTLFTGAVGNYNGVRIIEDNHVPTITVTNHPWNGPWRK